MKLTAVVIAIVLTGCTQNPDDIRRHTYHLVCKDTSGKVTYTNDGEWIQYNSGAWKINGYGGEMYKPGFYESCSSTRMD